MIWPLDVIKKLNDEAVSQSNSKAAAQPVANAKEPLFCFGDGAERVFVTMQDVVEVGIPIGEDGDDLPYYGVVPVPVVVVVDGGVVQDVFANWRETLLNIIIKDHDNLRDDWERATFVRKIQAMRQIGAISAELMDKILCDVDSVSEEFKIAADMEYRHTNGEPI